MPEPTTEIPIQFKPDYRPPPQPNPLKQWENGISGRLFHKLQERGKKEGIAVNVEGRLKMCESFIFGDERAHIVKHLRGGGVGETGGDIVPCIESHEYKRLPWWRETIDAVNYPFEFLPPPVTVVAQEASISNTDEIFNPERVLAKLQLNVAEIPPVQREQRLQEIRNKIRHEVERHTGDYAVRFSDGCLRLEPKTKLAKESLKEDNAAYEGVKRALVEAAEMLLTSTL